MVRCRSWLTRAVVVVGVLGREMAATVDTCDDVDCLRSCVRASEGYSPCVVNEALRLRAGETDR